VPSEQTLRIDAYVVELPLPSDRIVFGQWLRNLGCTVLVDDLVIAQMCATKPWMHPDAMASEIRHVLRDFIRDNPACPGCIPILVTGPNALEFENFRRVSFTKLNMALVSVYTPVLCS
jgi:hypothetical protein